MWLNQYTTDVICVLPMITQRMCDQVEQTLQSILNSTTKCHLYRYIVDHICLQYYLSKYIPKNAINVIASHASDVETLDTEIL